MPEHLSLAKTVTYLEYRPEGNKETPPVSRQQARPRVTATPACEILFICKVIDSGFDIVVFVPFIHRRYISYFV